MSLYIIIYIYFFFNEKYEVPTYLEKYAENRTYIYCKDLKRIIINYNCIFSRMIN